MKAIWRAFSFYLAPVALLAALMAIVAVAPRGCGSGGRMSVTATPTASPDTLPAGIMVQPGAILGGQALRIGEAINPGSNPSTGSGLQRPVGSFVYTRDGTIAYAKTGTTATGWQVFAIGGSGGGATAIDIMNQRAATLTGIPAATLTCYRENWITGGSATTGYVVAGGGTGAQSFSVGNTVGGMLTMTTGATAGSQMQLHSTGTVLGPPAANRFYFAQRFAVTSAVDAAGAAIGGIINNAQTASLAMGYCGSSSATNYVAFYDGNVACLGGTKIVTTTAIVAGVQHIFEIWSLADAKIHFAIDFAEVAGSPVTPAAPSATSMEWYHDMRNGGTAAARSVDIDFFQMCWSQT